MSESQAATSGVSGAGQGVSGSVGSYGSMTDGAMGGGVGAMSNGAGSAQGFSFGGGEGATVGPMETGPQLTTEAAHNIQTYGTTSPGIMDKAVNMYDRLNKGAEQNIGQAYKGMGNNPETYGYALAKLRPLMGGGGAPQAPQMVTNVSYQQPENSYLRRFRRY